MDSMKDMMKGMSKEDMPKMMEECCAEMTVEDKKKMMEEMMPEMMKECCSGMSEEDKKDFVTKVEGNIRGCCGC